MLRNKILESMHKIRSSQRETLSPRVASFSLPEIRFCAPLGTARKWKWWITAKLPGLQGENNYRVCFESKSLLTHVKLKKESIETLFLEALFS